MEFGGEQPSLNEKIFGKNPLIKKNIAKRIPLSSRTLILDKETGSWCICNKKELAMLDALHGKHLEEIISENSLYSPAEIKEFIVELYCRGLLQINNRAFYNSEVYKNDYISTGKALFLIIPTTNCNLSCRYCSAENPHSPVRRMEFETAKRIIDLIMEFPSDQATILFHGGEPLLEFDLVESVINYALQRNKVYDKILQFRLQTNGTLLSDKIARKLAMSNIGLGISFDGGQEINNLTRIKNNGSGAFDEALQGLHNAHGEHMEFGSICVLSRLNYDKVPEIMDFYARNKLYSIKVNPVSKIGKACQVWDNIGISSSQFLQAHTSYLKYLKKNGKNAPKEENIIHMLNILSSKMSTYMCMRSQCGAGKDFFAFTPDGNIYPCDRYRQNKDLTLGNVFSVNDLTVIRDKNQTVTEIFSRNINQIGECNNCDYKLFCRGGCTLETFSYFEEINRIHPWCDYYKKMYRRLFLFINHHPDLVKYLNDNIDVHEKNLLGVCT